MTQSWVNAPSLAICSFCAFELACSTPEEAAKRKAQHEHLRHSQPLPVQELAGADWQGQAIEAVRQVAARGADYVMYEALAEFGLADPPNAKSAIGRLASLVHDMRIAHPVGYQPSKRAGTKGSAAGVWNRDGSRCVSADCRARVGAA